MKSASERLLERKAREASRFKQVGGQPDEWPGVWAQLEADHLAEIDGEMTAEAEAEAQTRSTDSTRHPAAVFNYPTMAKQ